ncbi:TIGR02611 family protein [Agromyces sp. ZXT2-3]|uniref:TIGR02611 family protein n=1 Tax=Agromyces sp. ZXT2-3 TaxID=3461152 RepID=UPI0040550FA3
MSSDLRREPGRPPNAHTRPERMSAQPPTAEQTPLERTVRAEIVAAERPDRPVRRWLRGIRSWIDRHPRLRFAYRFGVAVLGGVIAVAGLALVPLPGPGWLVVFLGLAILGTEFAWARRLAGWVKRLLDRFWAWWKARRAARGVGSES